MHLCQVQHDEARPPRASPLIITPALARGGLLLRRHLVRVRVRARVRLGLGLGLANPSPNPNPVPRRHRLVIAQRELQVTHLG